MAKRSRKQPIPPAPVPSSSEPIGTPPGQGIRKLVWIKAKDLKDNPQNWRTHPAAQLRAVEASMKENGWAGALLYNERTERLIDGHARKKVSKPDDLVPVLVGDWTEAQERSLLLTLDPITTMATESGEALTALLHSFNDDLDDHPTQGDPDLLAVIKDLEYASQLATGGNPLYQSAFNPGTADPSADPDPDEEANPRVLKDLPNHVLDTDQLADQEAKALPRCPTCNQPIRKQFSATPAPSTSPTSPSAPASPHP